LRRATHDDGPMLLEWRNDPETLRQSLNTAEVDPAEHRRWLERRLLDTTGCRIYVAEQDGQPVAQLRVDADADAGVGVGVVSVSVAAVARGRGLGRTVIADGTRRAAEELRLRVVRAVVREGNVASLRAFRAAGYRDSDVREDGGAGVAILEWRADDESTP
jgi:UDP-2,4-diacetamido-2,4,6-trideoxy-beta-L-altropyranose hydrolase